MLKFVEGSVFSTPAKTMVNTVNCVGALGKGLALEFHLRYEGLEEDYIKRCKDKTLRIGRPALYMNSCDKWILNFPTKNHWRYPSKIEWIEEGLKYFVKNYKRVQFESVAFPKLGCGNGKLNWDEVKPLMIKYLESLDIDVYICLSELEYLDDIEENMVREFNNSDEEYFRSVLKMNSNQIDKIMQSKPIGNFRQIFSNKIVGKGGYIKLFKHYYNVSTGVESHECKEINMFNMF